MEKGMMSTGGQTEHVMLNVFRGGNFKSSFFSRFNFKNEASAKGSRAKTLSLAEANSQVTKLLTQST